MTTAPRSHWRIVRALPAALLAALLAAPQAWANSGGMTHPSLPFVYIGANGGSGNTVTIDSATHDAAYGGYSHTTMGPDTTGTASNNTLSVKGGVVMGGDADAGYAVVDSGTDTAIEDSKKVNVLRTPRSGSYVHLL